MTYRKLSRLSGISKTSLNDIANFREDPKQSTMIAIARALNMDVVDIFARVFILIPVASRI